MTERVSDTMTLPGPETVVEAALPNGMRAMVRHNPASPAVVVDGYVHGGTLYGPPRPGLASFATELLERGTYDHDFAQLSDMLESVGAEAGFGAGRHTTGFEAKCLAEDLPMVLGLMAEMLAQPSFPIDQVEQVRGQLITALGQRRASTRYMASVAFRELAYGPDHPYGMDEDGTPEGLLGVTRDDLEAYYASVLHPADGVVVVVGAVDPLAAIETLGATIGRWQPRHAPMERVSVYAPPDLGGRRDGFVAIPGKTQSDIVLGNASLSRLHPDWLPAALANTVLGVFGLMGRLGRNVRDARGLAYYAFSSLAGGLGPGSWTARAGVNPAGVDEAVEAMLFEMRRLRDEPIPPDELADVKAFVTGSLPLRLETNEGVAASLVDIALYDLGLDYLQRFEGLIEAIDAEAIREAAIRHLHPDAAAVAVAGPPQTA